MNNTIQHFGRNTAGGRDLIVGDIHGYFLKLETALSAIGFDRAKDRLFSVGDLVDRGPESDQALDWLAKPWFHAVRGNHEEAAIAWAAGGIERWHYIRGFGGAWNVMNPPAESLRIADTFVALPIGIELETERGLVGILHADCPARSWDDLKAKLAAENHAADGNPLRICPVAACITWGRERFKRLFEGEVEGVRAIVAGHNEVERLTCLDNFHMIDTGGWNGREFTILDAATLLPAEAPGRGLDWSGA
jgi:serine/threonine protein phosphatase 1